DAFPFVRLAYVQKCRNPLSVKYFVFYRKWRRKCSLGFKLNESSASTSSPDPDNLLGRRIQHTWREKGNVTKWKGTVLELRGSKRFLKNQAKHTDG
uniref:Uncharacterized protein n=1 Tax=Poecilia reticulata TaxID=8081 RepID=A0A3P9PXD2_POERE